MSNEIIDPMKKRKPWCGDIYKDVLADCYYMLSQVSSGKYNFICLKSGNRRNCSFASINKLLKLNKDLTPHYSPITIRMNCD